MTPSRARNSLAGMKGIFTAIVTPFRANGSFGIEEASFRKLIERQVDAGVHGIVVAGSTGEGQTMHTEEWEQALKIAVEYKSKIHIMGSCGSSSTWQTQYKLERLAKLGAHSALVSSPPYNKPTQEGLIRHFQRLNESVPDIDLMVYNIPGRTAVNITADTMSELWKIPSVKSLKESSGDWSQFLSMMSKLPNGKFMFSGDDPSSISFLTHGASGVVSVLSNVAPRACVSIFKNATEGKIDEARKLFFRLKKLTDLMFCESNPIPVKWTAQEHYGIQMDPRLPLLPLSKKHHDKILAELKQLKSEGIIAP